MHCQYAMAVAAHHLHLDTRPTPAFMLAGHTQWAKFSGLGLETSGLGLGLGLEDFGLGLGFVFLALALASFRAKAKVKVTNILPNTV